MVFSELLFTITKLCMMFTDWFRQPRGIVGRAPTKSAMRVIAGRHGSLSKISRGQCQKRGAYYTQGNQFSLRIWLKKRGADYTRVRIIRGCGLYVVKDGI